MMMETMTFTAEQWARHEKFVDMVRAAKKRKENWIKKMQAQWAEEDLMRQEAARSHYYDMITLFEEEIAMFKANKPQ